jgi:predicted Zn-dependent peptidase
MKKINNGVKRLLELQFLHKKAFEEYNLDNGLHVILQNDPSGWITSVMYHVGAKNENPERTGFAHFRTSFI